MCKLEAKQAFRALVWVLTLYCRNVDLVHSIVRLLSGLGVNTIETCTVVHLRKDFQVFRQVP